MEGQQNTVSRKSSKQFSPQKRTPSTVSPADETLREKGKSDFEIWQQRVKGTLTRAV